MYDFKRSTLKNVYLPPLSELRPAGRFLMASMTEQALERGGGGGWYYDEDGAVIQVSRAESHDWIDPRLHLCLRCRKPAQRMCRKCGVFSCGECRDHGPWRCE